MFQGPVEIFLESCHGQSSIFVFTGGFYHECHQIRVRLFLTSAPALTKAMVHDGTHLVQYTY